MPWTPEDVARVLINPCYALEPDPVITEDQWVRSNVKLIAELGAGQWLELLLDVLKGDYGAIDDERRNDEPGGS